MIIMNELKNRQLCGSILIASAVMLESEIGIISKLRKITLYVELI